MISSPRTSANKYLSGSRWEIMNVCFFLFFRCLFSYIYIYYVFICFFDCKCESLNRLGENRKARNRNTTEKLREKQNNRNTGYPAHEPPSRNLRDIYSRRFVGWISCISVFCFSGSFSVCVCFIVSFLRKMYSHSLFKLLYLQWENTHENINTT